MPRAQSVVTDQTAEGLLVEMLIGWGLDLTLPISRVQLDKCEVFVVDGDALIACFEDEVTDEVVRAIAGRRPLRAVFKDSGFVSDAARINAEQIFREVSPETEVRVI